MKFVSEDKSTFAIEITPLIDIVFLLKESLSTLPSLNLTS